MRGYENDDRRPAKRRVIPPDRSGLRVLGARELRGDQDPMANLQAFGCRARLRVVNHVSPQRPIHAKREGPPDRPRGAGEGQEGRDANDKTDQGQTNAPHKVLLSTTHRTGLWPLGRRASFNWRARRRTVTLGACKKAASCGLRCVPGSTVPLAGHATSISRESKADGSSTGSPRAPAVIPPGTNLCGMGKLTIAVQILDDVVVGGQHRHPGLPYSSQINAEGSPCATFAPAIPWRITSVATCCFAGKRQSKRQTRTLTSTSATATELFPRSLAI